MSLSRVKTWSRNEVLLSTDLNTEFNNIINNAPSLVFPLTADLDVGGFMFQDSGFTDPIQLHENLQVLDGKYSNDLGTAIAGIGGSAVTLMVAATTTVDGNHSIPSNVHLWFVGQGNFSVNSGATITLASPSQITATSSQTIFSGAGSILFSNAGVVTPAWWGFLPSAAAATNVSAYNASTASLPTAGGALVIPPGSYSVNDSLTHGNKPIRLVGAHPELCTISSTATASEKHGLIFTRSHQMQNLTVKTASDLTQDYEMSAIRFDLEGVSTGGELSANYKSLKVRGFNIALYNDGGDDYNIARTLFEDLDLKVAGGGTSYVGSAIHLNRVTQVQGRLSTIDQNDTGEHAIYCFGSKNIDFQGLKIRNASMTESHAVKLVGQGAGGGLDDEVFPCWSLDKLDVADCVNGVFVVTYGTERLGVLRVSNSSFDTLTSSETVPGAIFLEALGTSTVDSVVVDNVNYRNIARQGLHVSTAVGATVNRIEFANVNAYNWSTASAGTYSLVGTNGTGTFNHIHVRNVTANGNSNGRQVVGTNGMATTVGRVTIDNIIEINTTALGYPVADSSTSSTFNFAIGNIWTVSGTRTVTTATNAQPGQIYSICGTNSNFTLTDNSVYALNGNWVSAAGTCIMLVCTSSSPTFQELTRT